MEFGRVEQRRLDETDWTLPPPDPRTPPGLTPGAGLRFWGGPPVFQADGWDDVVYPRGLPAGRRLEVVSRRYSCMELNSTFYAVPSPEQVGRWAAVLGDGFVVCPKVPQTVSHGDPSAIGAFEASVRAFGAHLGPCFFQAPPSLAPDDLPGLSALFGRFAPDLRVAVELRHPGWFHRGRLIGRAFGWMVERGLLPVITDTPGRRDVVHSTLTGSGVLLRFLGHEPHASDGLRAAAWVDRLAAWETAGLTEAWLCLHQPDNLRVPVTLADWDARLRARFGRGIDAGPTTMPQRTLF